MTTLILALMTKHLCHNFDCELKARYQNLPCKIEYQFHPNTKFGQIAGQAKAFGQTYRMQWHQTGARGEGFFGRNGNQTLALYFKNNQVTAYVSEYKDAENYKKWTCISD